MRQNNALSLGTVNGEVTQVIRGGGESSMRPESAFFTLGQSLYSALSTPRTVATEISSLHVNVFKMINIIKVSQSRGLQLFTKGQLSLMIQQSPQAANPHLVLQMTLFLTGWLLSYPPLQPLPTSGFFLWAVGYQSLLKVDR